VRRVRKLGFTLDEVPALLRLGGLGADACGEVRDLAATQLQDFRKRIPEFRAMGRALEDAIRRRYGGDDATCILVQTISTP
jgi:MerR family mercuric resistance operon transcriptional regulator